MAIKSTQSPYWLLINGVWIQLEGVVPGSERSIERPSSDFVAVNGRRYIQQAPFAAREWTLDFSRATPEALAALAVAAEIPGGVDMLDTAAARSNMLETRSSFTATPGAGAVLQCGALPLKVVPSGTVVASGLPVRGVAYSIGCWTAATSGNALTVSNSAGTIVLPVGSGSGARRVQKTFDAPGGTGVITITTNAAVSGIQLVEGPALPDVWLPGERTPCRVAVGDASRKLLLARAGRLPLSDYQITLREAG